MDVAASIWAWVLIKGIVMIILIIIIIIMIMMIIIIMLMPPIIIIINQGCSGRGVQWMGVALRNKAAYDIM